MRVKDLPRSDTTLAASLAVNRSHGGRRCASPASFVCRNSRNSLEGEGGVRHVRQRPARRGVKETTSVKPTALASAAAVGVGRCVHESAARREAQSIQTRCCWRRGGAVSEARWRNQVFPILTAEFRARRGPFDPAGIARWSRKKEKEEEEEEGGKGGGGGRQQQQSRSYIKRHRFSPNGDGYVLYLYF